jgi:hypothetical protein
VNNSWGFSDSDTAFVAEVVIDRQRWNAKRNPSSGFDRQWEIIRNFPFLTPAEACEKAQEWLWFKGLTVQLLLLPH